MDFKQAGHINAAADNFIARLGFTGQALAGQRAGVQAGAALNDNAVNGHLFARLHNDNAADFNLVWVNLFQAAVLLYVGVIRANIHQIANITAAFAHRVALKPFAHLIEQHHGNGFQIIAVFIDCQRHCAHRGHGHQKVFIKNLPVEDTPNGLFQNIVADNEVIGQIEGKTQPTPGPREEIRVRLGEKLRR